MRSDVFFGACLDHESKSSFVRLDDRLEDDRLEDDRLEDDRLEDDRLEDDRLEDLRLEEYFFFTCWHIIK